MKPSLPNLSAAAAQAALHAIARPEVAKISAWFFKTAPGEYAADDQFIGVRVPDVRKIARVHRELSLAEAKRLLRSPIHEDRLLALLIWVDQARRGDAKLREKLFDAYLANTRHVNNWDLVDTSAPGLVGAWLLDKRRIVLDRLAKSADLWERRIAIVATFAFIRAAQFDDTLRIAKRLLTDQHDLIHKAVGWMLREVGKQDVAILKAFLNLHSLSMPRTMLRYAIERLPERERKGYLARRASTK